MAATERKPAGRATAPIEGRKPAGRALKQPERALKVVPRDPEALLREWIDELGALDAELVEVRPKLKRVDTLRGLLREHFAATPAGAGTETRGARYLATLGPCAFESAVDYAAVVKHMGLKAYAAIARPTLRVLEETLPPEVLAQVVTRAYSGARPVKTFPSGRIIRNARNKSRTGIKQV